MTTSTDSTAALTLLPWVRQGAATAITVADAPTVPTTKLAPSVQVTVALNINNGAATPSVPIQLRGPADVVGIDRSQVVRMDPAPNTADFEPTHFPLVEFDRPDYPWLFTPAKADDMGKLRPWLCLVVVRKQDGVTLGSSPDARLSTLQIASPAVPTAELPDLKDVWAWAHAQAAGDDNSDAAVGAALGGAPERSISRLICPRLLAPNTDYIACVVPTFDVGRKAGLGLPLTDAELAPTAAMALSWTSATKTALLPVYHHWEFHTGAGGDFASLVRRLRPTPAPARFGLRAIDIGTPGFAIAGAPPPTVPPTPVTVDMEGALRAMLAPNAPDTMPPWTNPGPLQTALAAIINAPVTNAVLRPADDPLLAPPLYGRWHGRTDTVAAAGTDWFQRLNLDPRLRAVAAFGTQVVQVHQEALMASAWDQAGELEKANQRLRQLQMSVAVGASLQRRHFGQLSSEAAVRVSAPVLARIRVGFSTAYAQMAATSVPVAAISTSMRRIGRQRGPVSRRVAMQGGSRSPTMTWVASLDAGTAALPAPPPSSLVTITAVAQAGRVIQPYRGVTSATITGYGGVPWFVVKPELQPIDMGLSFKHGTSAVDSFSALLFRRAATDHLARLFPTRSVSQGAQAPPPNGLLAGVSNAVASATVPQKAVGGLASAIVGSAPAESSFARRAAPNVAPNVASNASPNAKTAGLTAAITPPPPTPMPVPIDVIQLAPSFPQPMYESLRDLSQELLLPGIGDIAADTVLGLQTNRRFVDAYMVGLNFEMGRELLWRGFPTDQRGTYFDRFWGAAPDIIPLHLWNDRVLGGPMNPPARDRFVMMLRSSLLRRYPNALIYLAKAVQTGATRAPSTVPADELQPLFVGTMEPDVAFFGFNVTPPQATGSDGTPGYYVVIQEHPTEPRFGLELSVAQTLGTASHLPVGTKPPTGLTPPTGATWGRNAAHMASSTRRLPVRLAIHASQLLTAP